MINLGFFHYVIIGIIVLFLVYKVFVQNTFVIKRRLKKVREEAESSSSVTVEGDSIERLIESGRLYRIPILGGFYEKQIDALLSANIPMKPKEYFLATVVIFFMFFLLGTVATTQPAIGLVLGTIGLVLPSFYVDHLKRKRTINLDEQLPVFLNTLSNGLRSGLSLGQAIGIAVEDSPDPIGWEFKRVLNDMSMGRTVETSFNNLMERTQNENIGLLANAIVIQRDVGGNLSESLDLLARTIRENSRLQRYFRSTISQNKLSGIIIGLLPIGLMIVLTVMTPEYMMPLFTEPLGRMMLGGAASMMGSGVFVIKKITDLEV